MASGIYLMAHKSGLEGRTASGSRPALQIYAPDGETGGAAPAQADRSSSAPPGRP